MALTVATRMTAGAVTIGELACLQDVDGAAGCPVAGVAVVDDFGRLLGAIDTADRPDLFGCAAGSSVARHAPTLPPPSRATPGGRR